MNQSIEVMLSIEIDLKRLFPFERLWATSMNRYQNVFQEILRGLPQAYRWTSDLPVYRLTRSYPTMLRVGNVKLWLVVYNWKYYTKYLGRNLYFVILIWKLSLDFHLGDERYFCVNIVRKTKNYNYLSMYLWKINRRFRMAFKLSNTRLWCKL